MSMPSPETRPAGGAARAVGGYDLAACRRLMRGGSKSFFAASLLLPPRVRAPASALYAFCRLADDAIDHGADPAAAMRELTQCLDAIYAGYPGRDNADRALAYVVHRYAIPRTVLDALLDGFLWDAQGRRYETLVDVEDYGARVAGTVGAMMALLMDARAPRQIARACELGVAMQLTNIARDVGEDASNGRLYLPRAWLREAGIDPDAWLARPAFSAALGGVIARLLAHADMLYRRAEVGIAELPRDCRPAIVAARLVYAEIGRQLERDGLDSVTRRTVVSGRRKMALIARAARAAFAPPPAPLADASPLPGVDFLVCAVESAPAPAALPLRWRVPQRSFDERMAWMSDLFLRLGEQDRTAR
jgi:phytoene synthase